VKILVSKAIILKTLLLILIACSVLSASQPLYMLAKATLAQVLLERTWYEVKQSPTINKAPWAWADAYPVARLSYTKGDKAKGNKNSERVWIILAGMTGRNMAFAPSWLQDSAKPNNVGNTVISAHNDSHFSVLENVKVGDAFSLESRDKRLMKYIVSDIFIVDETDNSAYQFSDETLLTLITCYPFSVNLSSANKPKRLIVQAKAVYN